MAETQAPFLFEMAGMTAQRAFPETPNNPRRLLTRQEAIDRGLNKYRLNQAAAEGRIRYYKPGGWVVYDAMDIDEEIERLKLNIPWGELAA